MASDLHDFLSRDHQRLDTLLMQALAGDANAYAEFRKGLLWHIGVEEKILFPVVRAAGGDSRLLRQLHRDHAALSALLMPPPNRTDLEQIRSILEEHNPLEEGPGGLYAMIDVPVEQLKAFPPVPVAPHANSEITRSSIEHLLRSRTLHQIDVDEQSEIEKKTE